MIDAVFGIINTILVLTTSILVIKMARIKHETLNGYLEMRQTILVCLTGMSVVKALLTLDDWGVVDREVLWARTVNEIGCIMVVGAFVKMFMLSRHK